MREFFWSGWIIKVTYCCICKGDISLHRVVGFCAGQCLRGFTDWGVIQLESPRWSVFLVWRWKGGLAFRWRERGISEVFLYVSLELSPIHSLVKDLIELDYILRFNSKQDPLHGCLLHLSLHLAEVFLDLLPEFVSPFFPKQMLPVVLFEFLSVRILTLIVRLDHISALVLKEEPRLCIVEHLLIHSVLLLAFDQFDNVEVVGQLLLAYLECLMSSLCLWEALGTPAFTAAEEEAERLDESVGLREFESLSVHDQLVQEVKLAFLRRLVDVVVLVFAFDTLFDELFHLLSI